MIFAIYFLLTFDITAFSPIYRKVYGVVGVCFKPKKEAFSYLYALKQSVSYRLR